MVCYPSSLMRDAESHARRVLHTMTIVGWQMADSRIARCPTTPRTGSAGAVGMKSARGRVHSTTHGCSVLP